MYGALSSLNQKQDGQDGHMTARDIHCSYMYPTEVRTCILFPALVMTEMLLDLLNMEPNNKYILYKAALKC